MRMACTTHGRSGGKVFSEILSCTLISMPNFQKSNVGRYLINSEFCEEHGAGLDEIMQK
jgi:hypothetical protein